MPKPALCKHMLFKNYLKNIFKYIISFPNFFMKCWKLHYSHLLDEETETETHDVVCLESPRNLRTVLEQSNAFIKYVLNDSLSTHCVKVRDSKMIQTWCHCHEIHSPAGKTGIWWDIYKCNTIIKIWKAVRA